MDNSIAESGVSDKCRSLEILGLYDEKSGLPAGENRVQGGSSKRDRKGVKVERGCSLGDEWSHYAQPRSRKGTTEIPFCTSKISFGILEKVNVIKSTGLKKRGLKNGCHLDEGRFKINNNGSVLTGASGLNNSFHIFNDNKLLIVPKRPRDFWGRKKFGSHPVNKTALRLESNGVNSLSSFDGKNNGGTSKRKKLIHNPKENAFERIDPHLASRGQNGAVQSAEASTSKGNSNIQRKRWKSTKERTSDGSLNRKLEQIEEDDEDSLEQNAARMLSSRFDPAHTSFCGSSIESNLPSANGYLSSSFDICAYSGATGVELLAGRVLRPRNKCKRHNLTRKRRHFYELNGSSIDPLWAVSKRIKILWPLDQIWYFGSVKNYDPMTRLHYVKYDDRDEEWVNLQNERFKLLLLPNEKSGLGRKPAEPNTDVNASADNCTNNFMDSEPIISWLGRSTRQIRSLPFGTIKMQSTSHVGSDHSRSLDLHSSSIEMNNLSDNLILQQRFPDGKVSEEFRTACSKCRDVTFVYFRKRFHKRDQGLRNISVGDLSCHTSSAAVFLSTDNPEYFAPERTDLCPQTMYAKDLSLRDHEKFFLYDKSLEHLQLYVTARRSRKILFLLNMPCQWNISVTFGAINVWTCMQVLLEKLGTLMSTWPMVHLEILVMDIHIGFRCISFDGCLRQAVKFISSVLAMFHLGNFDKDLLGLQMPVTSARFRISAFCCMLRELVFVFYNFFDVRDSKWLYLNNKLRQHCMISKQPSPSQIMFVGIKALHDGSDQMPLVSFSGGMTLSEALQRRWMKNVSNLECRSDNHDSTFRRLSPFLLSFAAAPTFFQCLHMKLMMESNIAFISLHNRVRAIMRSPWNICGLIDENYSFVSEPSHVEFSGGWTMCTQTLPANCQFSNKPNASQICVVKPDLQRDGTFTCTEGLWQSDRSESSLLLPAAQFDKPGFQCHSFSGKVSDVSASWHCSVDGLSFCNGISDTQSSATDFSCAIHNLDFKPTGSLWPGYNQNLISCSTKLCLDVKNRFSLHSAQSHQMQNAYLASLGFAYEPKPRSYPRRGRPYKRIKNDAIKWSEGCTISPERCLESLSCEANILVISEDKGWRECGAQVVMDSLDHRDWRLLVNFSGVTRYSFKANNFLQLGTINRYTHAMMWKGDKDWILEFTDRSQWNLFKEMHVECYNRNVRASSIKNIPIPGVRLVDDMSDNVAEAPFMRSCQTYYRQIGTEVDMALDPTCVVYDMESDDEDWLAEVRKSSNGKGLPEITEGMFEKVMDMFEKVSYARKQDNFTKEEIEQFRVASYPINLIEAIYEHWQHKRKRKGMPLIRQFQPALWEQYQQQLREWELALSKNPGLVSPYKERVPQKPPMFAFCLMPRGLEVPHKGSKQRAHRRLSLPAHGGGFSRGHDKIQGFGRNYKMPYYGEKFLSHQRNVPDYSYHYQSSKLSPRGASYSAFLSRGSMWAERDQCPKLQRSKLRKTGTFASHDDPPASEEFLYSQRSPILRNGVSRLNMGSEWHISMQQPPEGFQGQREDQMEGADFDEFRLRDASSAAQHAANMAKMKREKAERSFHRAEVMLHKAILALMIAEAITVSKEDVIGDG